MIGNVSFTAALVCCILYAWSLFSKRRGRIVRIFAPSAVVVVLVMTASTGLKGNLTRVDFAMFY